MVLKVKKVTAHFSTAKWGSLNVGTQSKVKVKKSKSNSYWEPNIGKS